MTKVVVEPIALDKISELLGEPGETITIIIDLLEKTEGKIPGATRDKEIPDNAPSRIKNLLIADAGISYRIKLEIDDNTGMLIQWFVHRGIDIVWLFNLQYPINRNKG